MRIETRTGASLAQTDYLKRIELDIKFEFSKVFASFSPATCTLTSSPRNLLYAIDDVKIMKDSENRCIEGNQY